MVGYRLLCSSAELSDSDFCHGRFLIQHTRSSFLLHRSRCSPFRSPLTCSQASSVAPFSSHSWLFWCWTSPHIPWSRTAASLALLCEPWTWQCCKLLLLGILSHLQFCPSVPSSLPTPKTALFAQFYNSAKKLQTCSEQRHSSALPVLRVTDVTVPTRHSCAPHTHREVWRRG